MMIFMFQLFLVSVVLLGNSVLKLSSAARTNGQIVFPDRFTEQNDEHIGRNTNSHPIYDFANSLYSSITSSKTAEENILVSPFSIRTVLALVYLGAKGRTAEELRNVLHFPVDHEDLIEKFARTLSTVSTTSTVEYKMGNGIFVKESSFLHPNYTRQIRTRLQSDIILSDFQRPILASNRINNWVADITNNRIKSLISPSSISPDTSVFLANALFFSGKWQKPFQSVNEKSYFTMETGRQIQVEMMQTESNFEYGYVNQLQATGISIPFKDDRFKLIILKPQDGTSLSKVERLLKNYKLQNLERELGENVRNVVVKVPKFKLDMNYNLVNIMKVLGISSLFDSRKADLSGMINVDKRELSRENHVVNQMIHQAVLDVNEQGATAAGATGVGIYPISSPSFFTVDKPFLFLLNDGLTGPVFIGRVMKPSSIAGSDTRNVNQDSSSANRRRGSSRRS